jgi:1-acyl-sn-glycerol-3-phosphate acyltransferase
MRWPAYLIFALLSLLLAVISMFFWMVNPITALLLFLAAPPLRLAGYHPPVEGWSALGSVMYAGALWPLTLAPLHWLNFRVLRWGKWSYAGLLLLANVIVAAVVLIAREGS